MQLSILDRQNCLLSLPSNYKLANYLYSSNPQDVCFKLEWDQGSGYFGYSGVLHDNYNRLEIDAVLAILINIRDPIVLSPFSDYGEADSVSVEPLTVEDWETLQSNTEYLEEQILNQIRFVYKNQIFPLWIKGKQRIACKVSNISSKSSNECYKLTSNTEIYVKPIEKPRNRPRKLIAKAISTTSGISEILMNPLDIEKWLGELDSNSNFAKLNSLKHCYGFLKTSEIVPSGTVFISEYLKKNLEISNFTRVTIQLIGNVPNFNREMTVFTDESLENFKSKIDFPLVLTSNSIFMDSKIECKDDFIVFNSANDVDTTRFTFKTSTNFTESQDVLVGVDELVELVKTQVSTTNSSRILLVGKEKTGKTSLLKRLGQEFDSCNYLELAFTSFNCENIANETKISQIRQKMQSIYTNCMQNSPCVLALDNIHHLMSKKEANQTNLIGFWLNWIDSLVNVHLICTSESLEKLDSALLENQTFDLVETIKFPDINTKKQLIDYHLAKTNINYNGDLTLVASQMESFIANDVQVLVEKAIQQSLVTNELNFTQALKDHVPFHLSGISSATSGDWSQVAGMYNTKAILLETLEFPFKYARLFKNIPLRPRSGILLYGYPGTGKTFIASRIAKKCGCKYILVKGPELLNKYIGQSEQTVREVFEKARTAAPCVLFFDEFDSIAPKRGHDSTGVTDRVVNQLLTEMDGAQGLKGVYVIAATSRPDLVDPALLRPGRLDKSVFCDFPTFEERKEILSVLLAKISTFGINLNKICKSLDGFSAADIESLISNAHLKCIQENLDKLSRNLQQNHSNVDCLVKIDSQLFNLDDLDSNQKREIQELLDFLLHKSKETKDPIKLVVQQRHLKAALKECKPALSAREKDNFTRAFARFDSKLHGNQSKPEPFGLKSTLA